MSGLALVTVLLWAVAIGLVAAAWIGAARASCALDRLHYVALVANVATPLVALAVLVDAGWRAGLDAALVAGAALLTAPIGSHAAARAIEGDDA